MKKMKFDSTIASEQHHLGTFFLEESETGDSTIKIQQSQENREAISKKEELTDETLNKTVIKYQSIKEEVFLDDNLPLNKMGLRQVVKDFTEIAYSSILISCSYFSNLILLLLNLHFIGDQRDPVLLSAVGLGTVWINALGINTIYGLNYGFEILASKSYGADDFYSIGIYYKKGLLLICLLLSIFSLISLSTESLFILLGQSPAVANKVYEYVIFMLPSLWLAGFFDLRTLYYNAQEIFMVPIIIQVFTTAGHVGWCYLFTSFDFDVIGIAMAMNITLLINFLSLEIYTFFFNPRAKAVAPWTWEILKNFKEYLMITVPIAMTTVLEEFSYEINSVMAGLINETVLAAHVSMANSLSLFYCFSEGFSTGINTYVGISIGERKKFKAKRFALLGMVGGMVIMGLVYIFLYIFKSQWASFFTEEPTVNSLMVSNLPYFTIVGLVDAVQMCLGAILKVTGKGKMTLFLYLMCLYFLANPISFILGNVVNWELKGIWIGISVGLTILAFSFIVGVANVNWQKEIDNLEEGEEDGQEEEEKSLESAK